jgi:hypothetical protein
VLKITGPVQGISPTSGALLPHALTGSVPESRTEVNVTAQRGDLVLDGLIVRPWVSRLVLEGGDSRSELVHSSAPTPQRTTVSGGGTVRVYDAHGALLRTTAYDGETAVVLPPGGFAVAER